MMAELRDAVILRGIASIMSPVTANVGTVTYVDYDENCICGASE